MFDANKPLMRPTQHAEHLLITNILNGTWPPGTALPAERALSEQLGVTRPTLREALQRLARDRWITIAHGKTTTVNDYWKQGGMGILSTMAVYAQYLPREFVAHLLQARIILLPACARDAVAAVPDKFLNFLGNAASPDDNPENVAAYDWELQSMMAHNSGNLIYPLILNDFAPVFHILGEQYFQWDMAREASASYYNRLNKVIAQSGDVRQTVSDAMEESLTIWQRLQSSIKEQPKSKTVNKL